jgi:hypothetical protein
MRECLDDEVWRVVPDLSVSAARNALSLWRRQVHGLPLPFPPGGGGGRRGEQSIENSFTCSFVVVQL